MNTENLKEKIRKVYKEDKKSQLLLASSVHTPLDILEELCNSDDVEILSALLSNKKVDGKLRETLESNRKNLEKSILEKAKEIYSLDEQEAYDADDMIYDTEEAMIKLLEDKNTSKETLAGLYQYREQLAKHLGDGFFLMEDYEEEERIYDEESFGEYISDERTEFDESMRLDILHKFMDNPNTPQEILDDISNNNRNINNNRGSKETSKVDIDEENKKRAEELLGEWYDSDYETVKEDGYIEYSETSRYYRELAGNPYTPKEILQKIVELDFEDFSEEILNNRSATVEMILKVAKDNGYDITDPKVACALARRAETPDSIISELEESDNIEILLALIERQEKEKKFSEKAFSSAVKAEITEDEIDKVSAVEEPTKGENDKGENGSGETKDD